jgi:hypothetical protein
MRTLTFLLVGALLFLDLPAAHAEKRVALVMGNSAYKSAPRLINPANDSRAVSLLLKAAGFDVVEARTDLSIQDMRGALREFSDQAQDAQIALVYYAGHGIEVNGNNYLVPVDARLQRDVDVDDEAIPLDRVLRIIEPASRLRLVILDACRDNPFWAQMRRSVATRSSGRGLARVEPALSDTLIAFAARAGSTAADGKGVHSPFTAALMKYLTEPGLDVRIAFGRVRDDVLKSTSNQQEPFVYGSLGGSVVSLVPTNSSEKPGRQPTEPNAHILRDYELAAQVGTREAWDSFLNLHPSGFFADLARQQRLKLTGARRPKELEEKSSKGHAKAEASARSEQKKRLQKQKEASLTPMPSKRERRGTNGRTGLLGECLGAYVRRKGPFVPEGQSTASVKSRSDMTSMCMFAIGQRNYYWRRI